LEKRALEVEKKKSNVLRTRRLSGKVLTFMLGAEDDTLQEFAEDSKTGRAGKPVVKEEEYLAFPMAGKILSAEEQRDLSEKFEMVEKEIGLDVHQRFEQFAKKLEEQTSGP
jgi:hemerythrin-like domain-containing protein